MFNLLAKRVGEKIHLEVRRQVGRWETLYLFCSHLWPATPPEGKVAHQLLSEAEKEPGGSPERSALLPCPRGGKGPLSSSTAISLSAALRVTQHRPGPGSACRDHLVYLRDAREENTAISFILQLRPTHASHSSASTMRREIPPCL